MELWQVGNSNFPDLASMLACSLSCVCDTDTYLGIHFLVLLLFFQDSGGLFLALSQILSQLSGCLSC
jgi:hypothetical protein